MAEDTAKRFDDLSIAEQDFVAMVRRLEDNFGEDRTGIVAFIGDKERQAFVGEFLRVLDTVANLPYEGMLCYLLFKIPTTDMQALNNSAAQMHGRLDALYEQASHNISPEAHREDDE